ncbi:hypothetical protein PHLGIDRAFT_123269 [Phlebiopsis gigantea 11061_1 CR5-6]|uniref:D-isomer specific 2-hydroxyacid dehydrogenase NAD-binding domain-containing protein n=1 Tax=Phlebiopsis gigantea (strain 11061_1 CR5-6) TaxID=745531 RepID=A0A0C3RYZ0_PHLG1|nr:hypothetical protein PHLGIDRAFT_123269 [Phlebiopsis gigantea 11061_1 CR5-6]
MPSTLPSPPFANLLVVHLDWDLPPSHHARLAPYFLNITSVLKGAPTDAQLMAADFSAAGSNEIIGSQLWEERRAEREQDGRVRLANAAGVHVEAIGQYFIATTLALYHRLQEQILIGHNEKRWAIGTEFGSDNSWIFVQGLLHKTVGVLGCGHIGRECARLASASGARVFAANASGMCQSLGGYTIPGTGDPDGILPAAWFSMTRRDSLEAFLTQCDETLRWIKPSSVLGNVGRGDVVDTDALVHALDEGRLAGAVLDVVNPEPLPDGHTLFGRKNVIVTPHVSGRSLTYPELALDLLVTNLERLLAGENL